MLVADQLDAFGRIALLERAGHRCTLTRSVEAALARVQAREPVDVVVTEVAIGRDEQRGLRLLTELRACGWRLPVVLMTARADLQLVKFALNEGANHLLEKPFSSDELVAAIERQLERDAPELSLGRFLERAQLTAKERTVAGHLVAGLSSSEIAELEANSPKTIRQHISQIYAKCEVGSRAEFLSAVYRR